MKKVLIILGSYFPKPSANGICVQQLAHSYIDKGISVDIVATKTRGLSSYEKIEGVEVYRVKGRMIMRALEWCNEISNLRYAKYIRKTLLFLNKLKKVFLLPFWPLTSPIYTFRMYLKALNLHRKNDYDCVISVYNPIDALIAGAFLKKKHKNINLSLYFLDTLSDGIVPKNLSRGWLKKQGWFWDQKFFNRADSIFVMESHKKHYMSSKYRSFHNKTYIVDIPLLRKLEHSNKNNYFDKDNIHLVYTGNLIKRIKNPSYMLELLNNIRGEKKYVFHIYGGGDCTDIIENYRVENNRNSIISHGQVNVDIVHNALLDGDILINIGSLVDSQIPGKIFEYIAAGKPIISFYKSDSEPSLPYLKEYPLSLLIKEEWDKIDENSLKISEFVNQNMGKTVDFEKVREVFKMNTPESMVKLLLENKYKESNS